MSKLRLAPVWSPCIRRGISQSGPGEAPKLVDPAFLEEATFGDPVRYMNGQVGEVDGLGRLLRRGLAALADQQLAQAPAHETRIGMQPGEAFLRSQGKKLLQEPGRFGGDRIGSKNGPGYGTRPCPAQVWPSGSRMEPVSPESVEVGLWVEPEEGQETPELRESKHSDLLRGQHGLRPPRLERRASQKEVCSAFTPLKSPDSAPTHLEQS